MRHLDRAELLSSVGKMNVFVALQVAAAFPIALTTHSYDCSVQVTDLHTRLVAEQLERSCIIVIDALIERCTGQPTICLSSRVRGRRDPDD